MLLIYFENKDGQGINNVTLYKLADTAKENIFMKANLLSQVCFHLKFGLICLLTL